MLFDRILKIVVFGFGVIAALAASDVRADSGNMVCRGPMQYELAYWSGRQPAVFLTISFYPDQSGTIENLRPGHCRMEDGSVFEGTNPIEHALLIAKDYLDAPLNIRSKWGSGGSSPNVTFRAGSKSLSLLFNHLHGDLTNTSLKHFKLLVGRPEPESSLLIKAVEF